MAADTRSGAAVTPLAVAVTVTATVCVEVVPSVFVMVNTRLHEPAAWLAGTRSEKVPVPETVTLALLIPQPETAMFDTEEGLATAPVSVPPWATAAKVRVMGP